MHSYKYSNDTWHGGPFRIIFACKIAVFVYCFIVWKEKNAFFSFCKPSSPICNSIQLEDESVHEAIACNATSIFYCREFKSCRNDEQLHLLLPLWNRWNESISVRWNSGNAFFENLKKKKTFDTVPAENIYKKNHTMITLFIYYSQNLF